jgi:hypothetical protein
VNKKKGREIMAYILKAEGYDHYGNEIDLVFCEYEMFTITYREGKACLFYGDIEDECAYYIDPSTVQIVRELNDEEKELFYFSGHKEIHKYYRQNDRGSSTILNEIDASIIDEED